MKLLRFLKKSQKVLGMNARNLHYIYPFNSKRAKQIADNKILTKKVLEENKIPTAKTFATIKSINELGNFNWNSLPKSFVIKPNRGWAGAGVLILFGKKNIPQNAWIKADGKLVYENLLKEHCFNILEGNFSLGNSPDVVLIEERVKIHHFLKLYSFRGIPDIRVIVFNSVPVMTMLRLPTKESEGKANLALGAVGVGIDLANGVTTTAIYGKKKFIKFLPGKRLILSGIRIPYWQDILTLAVKAQRAIGLGFAGIDIVIDKEQGPKVLEINARPGLSIQLANLAGLKDRLKRLEELEIDSIAKGVAIGQNLFGGEIWEILEEVSGQKIIGVFETIKIITPDNKEYLTRAKIDTGAYSTSIDERLAKKLKITDAILNEAELVKIKKVSSALGEQERAFFPISFILAGERIDSYASIIDRSDQKYPVLIGRRDLKKFLINPLKKRIGDSFK